MIPILKRKISETEEANLKKIKRSPTQRQDRRRKKKKNGPTDQTWLEEEEREKIVREKLPCPFCEDECLRTSKMLASHLKYSHPKEKDSEVYKQIMAENIQPGFVCSICGMTLETEDWLVKHNAIYHNINIHVTNQYPCPSCGKMLKNKETLDSHIQHIHQNNKKQMCNVCGKILRNKKSLKEHTESQHSNLEFPCMECGRIFGTKNLRNIHTRRNHMDRERQHKCQKCEKAFRLPGDLRKHISQVHDKLKPFHCEVCQFRTATITNLNIHRKKSHERPSISRIALIEMVEAGQHPYYTLSDIPMIRSGPP